MYSEGVTTHDIQYVGFVIQILLLNLKFVAAPSLSEKFSFNYESKWDLGNDFLLSNLKHLDFDFAIYKGLFATKVLPT